MEIEGHFPANSGSRLQHFINVRVMNDLKKKINCRLSCEHGKNRNEISERTFFLIFFFDL